MKTLFLIRHAKSSWKDLDISDLDRPLNKRGKNDAPYMGKILKEMGIIPDIILSSSAKRAVQTANIIAKEINYNVKKIVVKNEIYEAAVSDLIRIINALPDNVNIAVLFGHNPTFTILSNFLSDKSIDNIPTCGIVKIEFEIESWNLVEGNSGKLRMFEYPKKFLGA